MIGERTAWMVLDAVRTALYDKLRWPDLDRALYQANKFNNSAELFAMREILYGYQSRIRPRPTS